MRANNLNFNQAHRGSKQVISPGIPRPSNSSKCQQTKADRNANKKSSKSPTLNPGKNSRTRLNQGQPSYQSRDEYFNCNKERVIKNVVYQKNEDYGAGNSEAAIKTKPDLQEALNKLKLKMARGVIGFDGKSVPLDLAIGSRYTCENRSLEQFTQIFPKSECSKAKSKKVKSKSQPKHQKNNQKSSKSQSKTKNNPQVRKTREKDQAHQKQSLQPTIEQKKVHNTHKTSRQRQQQQKTQPSTPHLHQLSQFYIEQLDTATVLEIMKEEQPCLSLCYLKRISRQTRSDYLRFMSRVCHEMKLSKEIFFLAVQLVDRYCNDQILLNRFKVLGIASLFLCVKFYDRETGMYLNSEIFKCKGNNFEEVEQIESQIHGPRYAKKEAEKQKKEQNMINIKNLLAKLQQTLSQELDGLPSADEILEFQTLILIRENFSIHRNDLSYWIDILTLHWDRFIFVKYPRSEFTKKCLFRIPESPENYFYLVQIIESCLHSLEVYQFKYSELVLTAIFFISRISLEERPEGRGIEETFNQYKNSLQKSNNLLFTDKGGVNGIFGHFLEFFQMQIGDILGCCKFVSRFLDPQVIETVNQDRIKVSLQGNIKAKFFRHYHNPKIASTQKQS